MEQNDAVKELAERLREAYLAGKAAERPFDRDQDAASELPPAPQEQDGWHH